MATLYIQVLAAFLACIWATSQAVGCKNEDMFGSKGCEGVKEGAKEALESFCEGDLGFASACEMRNEEGGDVFGLLVHACGEMPGNENCKG